ncbi:hypothetical protein RI367_008097 [Sorochytrium milnesiophthora]
MKLSMTRRARLRIVMVLTLGYFVTELVFGFLSRSVALTADAFHMLSDVLSLVVGMIAMRLASSTDQSHSFGWQRAEVVGALVNGVFLLGLCFTILISAIQRLVEPEDLDNPRQVLIVGSLGLGVNLLCLVLFKGSQDHSTAMVRADNDNSSSSSSCNSDPEHWADAKGKLAMMPQNADDTVLQLPHSADDIEMQLPDEPVLAEQTASGGDAAQTPANMNMRGVFLHILGDALNSVAVIGSALMVMLFGDPSSDSNQNSPRHWTLYVDPVMSILITLVIVGSTVPLVKAAVLTLLQVVPSTVQVSQVKDRILAIPDVKDLHDVRLWQLADHQTIAAVHVLVTPACDSLSYAQHHTRLVRQIQRQLHLLGVHSTTVQIEFADTSEAVRAALPLLSGDTVTELQNDLTVMAYDAQDPYALPARVTSSPTPHPSCAFECSAPDCDGQQCRSA